MSQERDCPTCGNPMMWKFLKEPKCSVCEPCVAPENAPYRLPESYVKEGLELAANTTCFGIPLAKLSPDELLACAAHAARDQAKERERNISSMKMLHELHKADRS